MSMITMGGEYNIQENAGHVLDNTKTGISVYGDYKLNNQYSLFGRYDKLDSEDVDDNQWNLDKDGELIDVFYSLTSPKSVKITSLLTQ